MRVLALLLLLLMPPMAQAQDDPLVQRGVPAEATAESAVAARELALTSGQRLAYERMAGSLGLNRGASDAQIESMVRSLIIESERITARGYSARITVNFNPQRVTAAGGRVPGGPDAAHAGPQAPDAPAVPSAGPAVTSVEALASYRGFAEWVEITRRLGQARPVERMQVVMVSGDRARLRLWLRSQPPEAATELAGLGIALSPAGPEPYDPRFGAARPPSPGEGWRLSLARAR